MPKTPALSSSRWSLSLLSTYRVGDLSQIFPRRSGLAPPNEPAAIGEVVAGHLGERGEDTPQEHLAIRIGPGVGFRWAIRPVNFRVPDWRCPSEDVSNADAGAGEASNLVRGVAHDQRFQVHRRRFGGGAATAFVVIWNHMIMTGLRLNVALCYGVQPHLATGPSLLKRAEHFLQQIGGAGHRILADPFLLVGDFHEQTVERLARDVGVEVSRFLAEEGAGKAGLTQHHLIRTGHAGLFGGLGDNRQEAVVEVGFAGPPEILGGGVVGAGENGFGVGQRHLLISVSIYGITLPLPALEIGERLVIAPALA